jgi:hypothetical protein
MFKYISDGEIIQSGRAFTDRDGIKRPSNWLERALPWELEAAGIQKYPDPAPLDYRFATGYDANGNPIWRPFDEVRPALEAETRVKANMLLQPTDWLVIREADNGTVVEPAIKAWREAIRLACGDKLTSIAGYSTTEALAAYADSDQYKAWPTLD